MEREKTRKRKRAKVEKIPPAQAAIYEAEEAELIAQGILSVPECAELPEGFFKERLPRLKPGTLERIIREERDAD